MAEGILERIALGDSAAVDECMRRYSALVWALARRFSTDHAESEDAVQEVFIDIWRSAGRFDETAGSETAFITTIARRRLIDRHRKRTRRIDPATLIDETLPAQSPAEDRLELAEEADQARKALEQLRSEERRILELSIYQGLSQREIAQATNVPIGTVKTHARRGLIRLRELLSRDSPAPSGEGKA